MESFFHKQSPIFLNRLKEHIENAEKQMKRIDKAKKEHNKAKSTQKKDLSKTYRELFLKEMSDFQEKYFEEYKRIIPIIFPGTKADF